MNLIHKILTAGVGQLEAEQVGLSTDIQKLERQLDGLTMERQQVITLARKKLISEADLALQLASLQFQELGLHKELDEKCQLAVAQEQGQLLSDWPPKIFHLYPILVN